MVYLDTSALAKRYIKEVGSSKVGSLLLGSERLLTSVVTFAEVHCALGRKYFAREISLVELGRLKDEFTHDWLFRLTVLELDHKTLSATPNLTGQFQLKALDAIHLSSAMWAHDCLRLGTERFQGEKRVEFWTADRSLARIAELAGLDVTDPENLP